MISSYGALLAQRASYLALHSSLFGPDGTVDYDYIITNSINCLLIGSSRLSFRKIVKGGQKLNVENFGGRCIGLV